jgi:hypothetical protein
VSANGAVPQRLLDDEAHSLDRLLALRQELLAAKETAGTPAVARALEMADTYLFLAISYLGYTDHLFPEE